MTITETPPIVNLLRVMDDAAERAEHHAECAERAADVCRAVMREVGTSGHSPDGWEPRALVTQVVDYAERARAAADEAERVADRARADADATYDVLDLAFQQSTGATNGARILAAHAAQVAEHAAAMGRVHQAR